MIPEQLPFFHLHPDWRIIGHDRAMNSQTEILNQIDREVRHLAKSADSRRPNHREESKT